jgi:hypothetical protein
MKATEKKAIALQILADISAKTTDATAFKFEEKTSEYGEYIYVLPDKDRRRLANRNFPCFEVFYHIEEVSAICKAVGARSWVRAEQDDDKDNIVVCIIVF